MFILDLAVKFLGFLGNQKLEMKKPLQEQLDHLVLLLQGKVRDNFKKKQSQCVSGLNFALT